ncbi:MAG: tellurite resistance TerB family protein [Candidatus Marinimicrobia bacterium]|nr:tellurite resistance TerB family protein [Candidatus Neomarinimicrobiota bacterium]
MGIQFDRPVEAMAAITWLICSADDVGSVEERDFLHAHVRNTQDFSGMSRDDFCTLLASTRTKLFKNFDNNGFCLAPPAIDEVITSAGAMLNADQKFQAYVMAVELAKSDGLVDEEKVILEKLRSRFQISFDMTNE